MKRLAITLLAVVALAATFTGCKKDRQYRMDDQDFVTQASSSNMFEIAAANVALTKTSNANVTAFANHMITDHGKAATEMMAVAQKNGLTVPTTMLQKHQEKLNMLNTLSGTAFDKQYAAMMVVSHQETISLFTSAAMYDGVHHDELRNFANEKLPTLKHHLEEAVTLQAQVGQ
jgi:putative membrane protein